MVEECILNEKNRSTKERRAVNISSGIRCKNALLCFFFGELLIEMSRACSGDFEIN